MILGDFHIHSTYSDGQLSISELVDLYGERGFGAIAITDHLCEKESFLGRAARYLEKSIMHERFNEYLECIRVEARRAWDEYGMVVIPGVEITKNSFVYKNSAHIVALGIHEFIDADQDVKSVCNQIHDQGGIAIAAHPVSTKKLEPQTFYLWNNREELRDYFDAWEVASGPYLFPEVLQSDLPKVANSDLHRPIQMRSWKTIVDAEPKVESILYAIRDQKLEFYFYEDEQVAPSSSYRVCLDPYKKFNLHLKYAVLLER